MKKSNKLTLYIIIAMIAGAILGYYIHETQSAENIDSYSKNLKVLTTIFLRLVHIPLMVITN
jgi:Na+/H+-dicarboxylate symporter